MTLCAARVLACLEPLEHLGFGAFGDFHWSQRPNFFSRSLIRRTGRKKQQGLSGGEQKGGAANASSGQTRKPRALLCLHWGPLARALKSRKQTRCLETV